MLSIVPIYGGRILQKLAIYLRIKSVPIMAPHPARNAFIGLCGMLPTFHFSSPKIMLFLNTVSSQTN